MAIRGTPNEGRDNVISNRVYTTNTLDLRLYVNLPDSLDASTVFADLVEPTGTGYAPVTLSGTWSETNGVVTYDDGTPDDVIFENTNAEGGANWSQDITGAAITDGTYILHFHDLPTPVTMTPGDRIRVDLSSLIAP